MSRLCVGLVFLLGTGGAIAEAGYFQELRYVDEFTFPTGHVALGTQVGGLSGIDYVKSTGAYYAISDDRGAAGTPRFYNLSVNFTDTGFTSIIFNDVQFMQRSPGEGGGNFPLNRVDPEAIRYDASTGKLIWTSEGERLGVDLQNPFVRTMNPDGSFDSEFSTPSRYYPTAGAMGLRRNLAFESLTISPDGNVVYTATENALFQDGTASTPTTGSPSRILSFDKSTGLPSKEWVYMVDPVETPPIPAGSFSTNGLVELLAIGPDKFLAVERSFSNGVGNAIKIFEVDASGATDVSGVDALTGAEIPVSKTLLYDLTKTGLLLDNIEGITFGPNFSNGNRSILLVSDNNFSSTQFTQFILLRAVPEPGSLLLIAIGGAGLFGLGRKRTRNRERITG